MDEMATNITKPWVIAHEPDGAGVLEVILAGPPDADHRKFGIVIADIVGHVARAYGVEEREVMKWVKKELAKRSAVLTGERTKRGLN